METPKKTLPASQAKALTIQNQMPIEHICKCIEDCATSGGKFRVFHEYISLSVLSELMKLGYSIKETTGKVGEDIYIISWA
jgi:hypothetical protein